MNRVLLCGVLVFACVSAPAGFAVMKTGCDADIKGNIGAERIYHVPGSQYYEQTVIDKEKGERWFCSESQAVDAGWRKAR